MAPRCQRRQNCMRCVLSGKCIGHFIGRLRRFAGDVHKGDDRKGDKQKNGTRKSMTCLPPVLNNRGVVMISCPGAACCLPAYVLSLLFPVAAKLIAAGAGRQSSDMRKPARPIAAVA